MTAMFDNYSGVSAAVRPHLTVLEDWIGHLDGMDLTRWQGEGENMHGIDEGTVDAGEAVAAVNALAAEIVRLEAANDELVRGMTEMAERYTAAMDRKNGRIEELEAQIPAPAPE